MLPIQEEIIDVNAYSRPGTKLKAVKGIVMHWTASPGAPAINILRYFGRLKQQNPADSQTDRYASAHFSVDDTSIYQIIPMNEMAYHVGSQTYTPDAIKRLSTYPNNCTIGIEMCINSNSQITEATFQNAADLVAYLLKKFQLGVDQIWTHKAVVGWKDCPRPWIEKPSEFARFKQEVQKRLSSQTVPPLQPAKPVQPAKPATTQPETAEPVLVSAPALPPLDPEVEKQALQSIDYLAEQGVVLSPDYWKKRLQEPMPVWAFMIMEARRSGFMAGEGEQPSKDPQTEKEPPTTTNPPNEPKPPTTPETPTQSEPPTQPNRPTQLPPAE
ncbi:N-acetylmuramoyl-L-alanine amidase [Brevibacillus dissolubilis]|uniref:N-acetylmuramoyl-L-alanine amidase n=1 Tax=Brevibacillus dissolubilis TaxID=1844116 RepID=UPI001116214B|nr:N-acetylmuramoyl-L-alanine amidase [Brevibacillus dissolubilis]